MYVIVHADVFENKWAAVQHLSLVMVALIQKQSRVKYGWFCHGCILTFVYTVQSLSVHVTLWKGQSTRCEPLHNSDSNQQKRTCTCKYMVYYNTIPVLITIVLINSAVICGTCILID